MEKKQEWTTLSVKIPMHIHEILQQRRAGTGVQLQWIVKEALVKYLEPEMEGKQIPESPLPKKRGPKPKKKS